MNRIIRHQTRRFGLTYRMEVFLTSRAAEAMHTLLRHWPSKKVLHYALRDAAMAGVVGLCIGVVLRLLYSAFS